MRRLQSTRKMINMMVENKQQVGRVEEQEVLM